MSDDGILDNEMLIEGLDILSDVKSSEDLIKHHKNYRKLTVDICKYVKCTDDSDLHNDVLILKPFMTALCNYLESMSGLMLVKTILTINNMYQVIKTVNQSISEYSKDT